MKECFILGCRGVFDYQGNLKFVLHGIIEVAVFQFIVNFDSKMMYSSLRNNENHKFNFFVLVQGKMFFFLRQECEIRNSW